jgi:hypothetical protein
MTRSMIKPRTLGQGDRVAAVSLSSGWPSVYPRAYEDGKRQFQEAFDVEVVESRHALADTDWLAAHPEALTLSPESTAGSLHQDHQAPCSRQRMLPLRF